MPDGRPRTVALAGFTALAAVLAAVALERLGWPGVEYRDGVFFQVWTAARSLLSGADPSTAAAVRSPYPPWTTVVALPFAPLRFDIAAAAWLAAQVVAVAAALTALRTRVLLSAPTRDGFVLAGLAFICPPLWLAFAGGTIDGLQLGGLAGALAASLAGRPALAGVLLATLTLKPESFLVVVPLYLVAAPRRTATAAAFGLTVAAIVGAAFALQPDSFGLRLTEWTTGRATPAADATIWTLDRALPFLPPGVLPVAIAITAFGAFVLWWTRARPLFEPLIGAALCLSLSFGPLIELSDLLALLVPTAVVVELLAHILVGRRVVGLALAVIVLGALPWGLYALVLRQGYADWIALVPLVLFAVVILAERWSRMGARAWTAAEREGAQVIG